MAKSTSKNIHVYVYTCTCTSQGNCQIHTFSSKVGWNLTSIPYCITYKRTAKCILNGHPWLAYETNMKGDTPLYIASKLGHLEMATLLMNHYKEVSTHAILEAGTDPLHMVNREKNTVLHEAAQNGCLDVVKLLIQKDRQLASFTNEAGESPLFLAVDQDTMTAVSAFWKLLQIAQFDHRLDCDFN